MWEDSRNKRGGRWLVSLAKQQRHSELDRLWLETVSGDGERRGGVGGVPHWKRPGWGSGSGLQDSGSTPCDSGGGLTILPFWPQLLCLIGESFEEHSREVCGAVINIRTKGDKIALWTREAENQADVLHIG